MLTQVIGIAEDMKIVIERQQRRIDSLEVEVDALRGKLDLLEELG